MNERSRIGRQQKNSSSSKLHLKTKGKTPALVHSNFFHSTEIFCNSSNVMSVASSLTTNLGFPFAKPLSFCLPDLVLCSHSHIKCASETDYISIRCDVRCVINQQTRFPGS